MPPSTGLSGTQCSTLNSARLYAPEGPENITTLNWSAWQIFTTVTQHLTSAVVMYKYLGKSDPSGALKQQNYMNIADSVSLTL
jgi:hypothetical protein